MNLNQFSNVLSKEQMRMVKGGTLTAGGGGCGVQTPSGAGACGISQAEAMAWSAHWGTYWCCDSCAQTGYCGSDGPGGSGGV